MRPASRHSRARAALATLLGALALALLIAPPALASYFAPEDRGGSPNADDIHTLYLIVFFIGIAIFVLVEGVLIYSVIKFRYKRGGPPAAQIRGNTPLEVGWTIGAALILVVLTVVTFAFLGPIKNPVASKPGGFVAEQRASQQAHHETIQFASVSQPAPPGPANTHLNIRVNGQQYIWRFDYPGFTAGGTGPFSYHDMYVPTDTTVTLDITSSDVAHSWWIPALGGKADAIPGYHNHTWFRISKPGVYQGQCAELCGENHADMKASVIAVSPAQFRAWEGRQVADLRQSQALLALSRKTRGQVGP